MGCLLYELAVGRRAFYNDYAVLQYCERSDSFVICLDNFRDEEAKPAISEAISRMLQKEPSERPTAETLFEQFSIHCRMQPPRERSRITVVEQDEQMASSIMHMDGKSISRLY